MTANELIERLSALTEEQRELSVACEDGFDPSDPHEINSLEIKQEGWTLMIKGAFIYLS
jgi:hypothetical protein